MTLLYTQIPDTRRLQAVRDPNALYNRESSDSLSEQESISINIGQRASQHAAGHSRAITQFTNTISIREFIIWNRTGAQTRQLLVCCQQEYEILTQLR